MQKLRVLILIFLFPLISHGQFGSPITNFKGDIKKIVEIPYGRKWHSKRKARIIKYNADRPSRWKYETYFDEKNRVLKETTRYRGRIRSKYDFTYVYDSINNEVIERKYYGDNGNFIEEKHFLDSNEVIVKVKISSFNSKNGALNICGIQQIKYDSIGNMTSYISEGLSGSNKSIRSFYYDSLSRVIRMDLYLTGTKLGWIESEERSGLFTGTDEILSSPELSTRIGYHYNSKGQLDSYYVEYFNDEDNPFGKAENYWVYFEYDIRNNWIKKYGKIGSGNKTLSSIRKIKYK